MSSHFHPAAAEETRRNVSAIRCLNDAIDGCGIPRQVLAADYIGVGEAQFSKLTHASAIDMIDELPDEVLIEFLDRYGRERGFEVRQVTPRELDDQVQEAINRLVHLARLRTVRIPKKPAVRQSARDDIRRGA